MNDWLKALERLQGLRDAGTLTDGEFEIAKARLSLPISKTSIDPRPGNEPNPAFEPTGEPVSSSDGQTYEAELEEEHNRSRRKWFVLALASLGLISAAYFYFRQSADKSERAIVIVAELNCRVEPNATSAIVKKLTGSKQIDVLARNGDWAKVRHARGNCWVSEKYISENMITKVADLKSSLSGPTSNAPKSVDSRRPSMGNAY